MNIDITKIKILIDEKFKTQNKFAESISIDNASLSRYLTGETTPRPGAVLRIAKGLDVPVFDILIKTLAEDVVDAGRSAYIVVMRSIEDLVTDQQQKFESGEIEAVQFAVLLENLRTTIGDVKIPDPADIGDATQSQQDDDDPLGGNGRA